MMGLGKCTPPKIILPYFEDVFPIENGGISNVMLVFRGVHCTPPKLNSSPLKNGWLEDDPFLIGFQ